MSNYQIVRSEKTSNGRTIKVRRANGSHFAVMIDGKHLRFANGEAKKFGWIEEALQAGLEEVNRQESKN